MPSYYYHLKFELYPAYPPESRASVKTPALTAREDTVWNPVKHSNIFANLPSHQRQLRQRTLSFPPPQPEAAINPEVAFKDWRFGEISIESVDADDCEERVMSGSASSAAAAAVGPSMGSAGQATKARYVPLAAPKNTNLGWGIVHLYREGDETPELSTLTTEVETDDGQDDAQIDCTTVCIPAVPSYFSPSDFLGFIGERWRDQISHYRMVMTGRLNRYLVLMKFRDSRKARLFRREFDGKVFNHIERHAVHDPFTPSSSSSSSTYSSLKPFPPATPNLIELPTCPVCLERMDDTTGLLTIPCQHVFHCSCLQKWKGSGCPVCRHTNRDMASLSSAPTTPYDPNNPYAQPFGSQISNLCFVCDSPDDLWICLICGNHWKDTAHTFALELDTQHVWDYAGDMWVHRLIRDKGDAGPDRHVGEDVVPRTKLDSMGMEYTHLLTSQLESQRIYFEEMLSKAADKAASASAAAEKAAVQASGALHELGRLKEEQRQLRNDIIPTLEKDVERERTRANKSTDLARGFSKSLQEEKKVSEGLMKRIEHVNKELGTFNEQLQSLRLENADLKDQNHDLTMFISGQEKLKEMEAEGQVEEGEIQEGSVALPEEKKRRKANLPTSRPSVLTIRAMADTQDSANGATPSSSRKPKPEKELYPMTAWKYDAFLHTFSVLTDLFFREIHPRGSWRVPKKGPILFVAAPHANQFVDGLVLQRTLKEEANRRVGLLIAEKSVHGFIGWGSRQTGSVPVGRAQDKAKPARGFIYMPDPVNDPTLIRGVDTDFENEGEVGGMVFLPSVKGQSGSSVDIAKILGPEELRTKRAFKGRVPMQQLTGRDDLNEKGDIQNKDIRGPKQGYEGTKYKLAPHIDQTDVYKAVFTRLRNGGCIGIFPEGGSHDRTELLPLKAGVAIMALGALAESPDCGLQIVPVGMNYFHAHKFRSRAVVEFGAPFQIPPDLVDKYKNNQRRDAIAQTLDMVYQALSSVTVSAPDYDTLMCIQAARRLYNTGKKMPLPMVVELNRRLAVGFSKYREDPRIVELMNNLRDYNKQLRYLNIKDHQVSYGTLSVPRVLFLLFYRIAKILVLSIGVVPGLVLFAPVFVATKYISHKKAKEALAGSSVKIQGRDVMATWKLLVAMAFAPALYNLYSVALAFRAWQDRFWGYLPDIVPFWSIYVVAWIIFPAITYAAFRIGEVGMDILKSLRPLVLCLSPTSSYGIQRLRQRRLELSEQVVKTINDLGPDMYDDFDKTRLVSDPFRADGFLSSPEQAGLTSERRDSVSTEATPPGSPGLSRRNTTMSSRAIPRNESFSNIGAVGIFATRPPSRSRSRSSSGGGGFGSGSFPISGFTALDSKEGFDEASKKIKAAMMSEGVKMRRKKSGLLNSDGEGEDDSE
ncbi:hypothetical protein F5Y15DRAFT_408313 [Xylariaceae sp. FL0016]|nr:hypothetical protein F5Y15DRAFT_408313 [Xylariaceae sp. FL0016]